MSVELQPLVLESTLTIQKILEAKNHKARCLLLKHFMDVEKKRLDAKSTLQGMFAGDASVLTKEEDGGVVAAETDDDDNDEDEDSDDDKVDEKDVGSLKSSFSSSSDSTSSSSSSSSTSQGALFVDEPDAFQ